MEMKRVLIDYPIFSICIPQYNRTSFLIKACESLINQTFKDFELCISDDCSTDGREPELLEFLEASGLSYIYRRQEENKKYDANLRASIELSRGKYSFLLGNDDSLSAPTTLENLYADIQMFGTPDVVISNYEDYATGRNFKRIKRTRIIGRGPEVASSNFRNFSFVSGVLLDTRQAKEHSTARWNGSEMYQMYIGCRIIAEGGSLLGLDRITVRKNIRLRDDEVDSYALKPHLHPCAIIERQLPMGMIGKLVADAITPSLNPSIRREIIAKIFFQVFMFTYPFWIFEYRQVQSWKYALGVCLGMRPRNTIRGFGLRYGQRLQLTILYGLVSILALVIPIRVFNILYPSLYSLAKACVNR